MDFGVWPQSGMTRRFDAAVSAPADTVVVHESAIASGRYPLLQHRRVFAGRHEGGSAPRRMTLNGMRGAMHHLHQHHEDGSWDSICLQCFLTIGSAKRAGGLAQVEHRHVCAPAAGVSRDEAGEIVVRGGSRLAGATRAMRGTPPRESEGKPGWLIRSE